LKNNQSGRNEFFHFFPARLIYSSTTIIASCGRAGRRANRIAAARSVFEATAPTCAVPTWLEHQLVQVSAKAPIAEAIRYGLHHWDGLTRFVDDGRIELDTNIVERGIRPIVLNRKNALFAGHDQGAENWACIASLIETCKLNGVDPQAYVADVLTRLVNLWPASRIDQLMPWAWAAEHANKLAA
jgi:transposase